MISVERTIDKYKLIKKGEIIGVAVSGGQDSMALLHKLVALSEDGDFEVVAITVDHGIRENSDFDARFVIDYCRERHIRAYKFRVECLKLAKEQNKSLETVARDARYGVFDSLIAKGVVDKIAVAHHTKDQAETVLLHLFRGAGLAGAKGMEIERKGTYIRPLLETSKSEILDYLDMNQIPFVNDSTNEESEFSRNYIRNEIMPLILKKWPSAVEALNTFAKACAEDDEFINSQAYTDGLIIDDKLVKIPNSYFLYHTSVVTRIIFKALKYLEVTADIERKHIELIKQLALFGKNGDKFNLPNELVVIKEYDFVTIINAHREPIVLNLPFKCGTYKIPNFGSLVVKRVKEIGANDCLYLDSKKVPKTAEWRFRENGDNFEKFGGGTKKLKDYLIDKKIPARLRSFLPVLANENEIYCIAGVEISNKVRVDASSSIYSIKLIQNRK